MRHSYCRTALERSMEKEKEKEKEKRKDFIRKDKKEKPLDKSASHSVGRWNNKYIALEFVWSNVAYIYTKWCCGTTF